MSPLPVVFRAQALSDLEGIAEFIEARDSAAATRVIQKIHRTIFKTIANFPHGGRLDRETGARAFPVSGLPYLIVYVPGPDFIDVIGVFHSARDPSVRPKL